MKKKILVITPFFYPHVGGSEKYVLGLYSFLKEKNPKITVDVLCYNTDNSKTREVYRGLNILRIPCWQLLPGQFCIAKPSQLFKFISQNWKTYDLIHCSTRFFDSSWWGPVIAKLAGKKVILTDHCAYHPTHRNPFVRFAAKFIDLTISGIFLHLFDKVFVESEETKDFLKKVFGIESRVAYPGINVGKINRRKISKRINIAYIGRLIESKGVKNLFKIIETIPSADLVIAGPGPLAAWLKSEVKRKKIRNISISGPLTETGVRNLLKKSEIFAYPTLHSEGLPMSILEAGGFGLAVIANGVGGIGEVILDGKTGILVKPRENDVFKRSLIELINNKERRLKLGENLQNLIEKKFNWKPAGELVIKELS